MENLNEENEIIENEELEDDTSLADDIERIKESDKVAPREELEDDDSDDTEEDEPKEAESKEEPEEDEKLLRAREEYKKRQEERRKKAQEQQTTYEQKAEAATDDADKQAIEYIKQLQKQQVFERNIKQAEVELTGLEGEFKVAYPDYEDKVNQALKLTKYRLVQEGMGEAEAEQLLKREKVLLADKAASRGEDPVEAVYKEAKAILNVFEKYAEDMGYTKGKKKTNLQALREVSKPNAMSGGAGKGAAAARKTYDDMEGDEVDDLTLEQLMKGV
jgi:hypothetical protein